jgi:hypothetical protein
VEGLVIASQYLSKFRPANPYECPPSGLVRLGAAVVIIGIVVLALHLAGSGASATDTMRLAATAAELAR